MHGTLDPFWTEAKVDLLRRLATESKLSARRAAMEMGITLGSAIGKAFRLGIRFQSPTITNSRKSREEKIAKRRTVQKPSRVAVAPEPNALRLTFDEMATSASCKWPVGEYPYKYCGHVPTEGMPYCEHHCSVAYVAPQARNRAPRPR